MGHHGWQGDPPPTEALARERIISAATRCIERMGVPKTTLSDVAEEVGVTRQTIYRYFPNLADLLSAVAETGAADFIERMHAHLASVETPIEAVVEAIAFAVLELPLEPRIGILLEADDQDLFGRGVTSATGFEMGTRFLRSLAIDWEAHGVLDDDLHGLVELMLRLVGSFLQHPPAAPRAPDDLRRYLRRWLGPALAQPRGNRRS